MSDYAFIQLRNSYHCHEPTAKDRTKNDFKSTSEITRLQLKCRMYNCFKPTSEITTSIKMQNV